MAPETRQHGDRFNVLFLCTGNSARSILAEQLVNHWGQGKFRGYSAGSHPKGTVHPIAIALLEHMKLPTAGLRSKSWDEFARPEAPRLDFVLTVCDDDPWQSPKGDAAGEVCPVWLGQSLTAHWGVSDPAAVQGPETRRWLAFLQAFRELENRIKIFTSLPFGTLDRAELKNRLAAIGRARVGDPREG
jgi:arsenate reductase